MKRLLIIALTSALLISGLLGQNSSPKVETEAKQTSPETKKPPLFGIIFSGYVKTDLFLDSRQTVGLREGHFLLFPENEKLDADGNDINAKANYNILSIQTRVAGSITAPDALGAKTSGYIEAEFFGNSNPAINTFRLRHAWVKLNWKKTELMVGHGGIPCSSPSVPRQRYPLIPAPPLLFFPATRR